MQGLAKYWRLGLGLLVLAVVGPTYLKMCRGPKPDTRLANFPGTRSGDAKGSASGGAKKSKPYQSGDRVIVVGKGLGSVGMWSVVDGDLHLVVQLDAGGVVKLPLESLARTLRKPISRQVAETHLASLRGPAPADLPPFEERIAAAQRALQSGSIDEQVRALHHLYRSPYRWSPTELQLIGALEASALAEIAAALGMPPRRLARQLREASPGFQLNAPPRPNPQRVP